MRSCFVAPIPEEYLMHLIVTPPLISVCLLLGGCVRGGCKVMKEHVIIEK